MKSLAILFAAALLATPALSAEKSWMVGNFEGIEIGGAFDVEVVTGQAQGVTATGPQGALDKLLVKESGGKLTLRSRTDSKWFSWSDDDGRITVRVTVPRLNSARLSGSGDVTIDNMAGTEVSLALSGSGDMAVANIRAESLSLSIAGSGDLEVAGECRSGNYSVAGSGTLSAGNLACRELEAKVAGSGDIVAAASRTAKADIEGSGDIRISGGAKCESRIAGSGGVDCS